MLAAAIVTPAGGASSPTHPPPHTQLTQAFAELNILINQQLSGSNSSNGLPEGLLRGYHSFVLQPRARLWGVYSAYVASRHGGLAGSHHSSGQHASQHGGPLATAGHSSQLALLRFLLETVLAPYPDASLAEVTLSLPPHLVSWASRWGMLLRGCSGSMGATAGPVSCISLIEVEAYAPLDPSSSRTATMRRPARKLFVPAML
jgi:hypothetical protein